MRRLLSVLALFVLVLGGRGLSAAIAVVQPTAGLPVAATQCTGTPTTCDYVLPAQPGAGNALVVSVSFGNTATINTVGDTGVNTYASTLTGQNGTFSKVQIWYATNITTAASFKVTATASVGGSLTVFAAEYSGVASPNASALDKQVQGTGSSTTPAVASTTATNASSLYVAAIVHDGSGTVTIAGGGTFTERGEAENTANQVQGYEDLISSAAQTGPFTLGASSAWADTMIILIPSGVVASPPMRMLLGVGGAGTHRRF